MCIRDRDELTVVFAATKHHVEYLQLVSRAAATVGQPMIPSVLFKRSDCSCMAVSATVMRFSCMESNCAVQVDINFDLIVFARASTVPFLSLQLGTFDLRCKETDNINQRLCEINCTSEVHTTALKQYVQLKQSKNNK